MAERTLEPEDGVELPPLLGRERLSVELGIALVVAAEAVRQALEQERPLAGPGLREEVEEAVRFARESPFPPAELTAGLVYA